MAQLKKRLENEQSKIKPAGNNSPMAKESSLKTMKTIVEDDFEHRAEEVLSNKRSNSGIIRLVTMDQDLDPETQQKFAKIMTSIVRLRRKRTSKVRKILG
jgi:hypothetical protein